MILRVFLSLLLGISFFVSAEEVKPSMTVYIPMRDGIALPTDIYLPDGKESDLPCVLVRTPAGRTRYTESFIPLTKAGYAVAIQDARNYIDPEGKTMPCLHDGWGELQDGFDTVQWLSKSPVTNGKIGTIGFSAMGILQLLMAPSTPPNLCCQYIGVAPGSLYHHAMFQGGQFLKHQVEGWLGYYAKHPSILNHVCSQRCYNDFWASTDTMKVAHKVKVPAIHYGGWFDTFSQGSIDAFLARQENGGEGAKGKQKLIMGPWGHYFPLSTDIGDFKVPLAGMRPPVDISPQKWFDYYLKGENNGIADIPSITYYVMGPFDGTPSKGNKWKFADKWPVPATEKSLFLSENGSLQETEARKPATRKYTYDPSNPVPTTGGRNLFLESGPKDQSSLESRKDVIVFTSDEFEEDTEITGRIEAKIWFSTDCEDTDLIVKMCDVYPDGRSVLITDGIVRLGALEGEERFDIPKEISVDLWSTSIVFAKGHKLRVLVTSSDYPRYEKNRNVKPAKENGEKTAVAHNLIHMGREFPSRIILPVVKEDVHAHLAQ